MSAARRYIAKAGSRAVRNPLRTVGADRYKEMKTPDCGADQFEGLRQWFKDLGVGTQSHAMVASHWINWLDDRLRPLGFRTSSYLGAGARGILYAVSGLRGEPTNIVAKITQDPSEAATVARLGKKHPMAFPVSLGAWRIKGEPVWVILREGLLPLTVLSRASQEFLERNKDAVAYAMGHGDNCALVTPRKLERLEEDLEQLPASDRAMVTRYFDGVRQAHEEYGVQVLDTHLDNIRVRRRPSGQMDLVVSDLGFSVGPEVEVPVAANPRLRFWGRRS